MDIDARSTTGRYADGPEPSRLSGHKFDHIISLGSHCYASTVFKRLGLKTYSGPFDWMFSTVPMVQACIESNFQQFLDQQYYKPIVSGTRTEYKHTFYQTHWMANFTHYDPLSDSGYAYLERCVNRFRRVLSSDATKLFLFVAPIHAHERPRYVGEFEALTAAITARSQNSTVIGVTVATVDGEPEMVEAARISSSRLFHRSAASSLTGTTFDSESDDVRFDRFVTDIVAA
jgi:hypothetical protein